MEQQALIKYFETYIPLSNDEIKLIKSSYSPKLLRKKEILFEQGKRCTIEAFVLSGTLRAYYMDNKGHEHVLNFALPGWWVGDIASFNQGTDAFLSVQALEDSELLVIDPETKEELLRKVPALERVFRIVIQNHLASLQKRFLVSHSETADHRYINLISKIPKIEQLVPQYQIASYLGILPESLSRLKKKMIEGK